MTKQQLWKLRFAQIQELLDRAGRAEDRDPASRCERCGRPVSKTGREKFGREVCLRHAFELIE